MSRTMQVRNVPEDLHRKLKARATLAGMSLSDYLLDEISRSAERPTIDELLHRLRERSNVKPALKPADAVRAQRDRM